MINNFPFNTCEVNHFSLSKLPELLIESQVIIIHDQSRPIEIETKLQKKETRMQL